MSEAKHTPGPWHVDLDREFICDGDDVYVEAITDGKVPCVRREICTCMLDTGDNKDGEDWEEDVANARLISAAPDLLAACKRTVEMFDAMLGMFGALEGKEGCLRQSLVEAIAKAEGKAT